METDVTKIVKPLDLANVIRDAFLAGAGMDTASKDVQRIPDEILDRLNRSTFAVTQENVT